MATDPMTALSQQMESMAESMKKMALDQQQSLAISQSLEKKQEAMQAQIDAQQAQLNSSTVVVAGKNMQLASKDDWQLSQQDWALTGEDELVSQKQCAEMIQKALNDKVAPILHATVGTVVQTCAELTDRVQKVEEEVKTMKIRCAWIEKDMLQSQVEVAKRTILARNWPEWMTADDRALTIHSALHEADLNPLLVDIVTLTQVGEGNKKKLAPLTVITVPAFAYRKDFLNVTGSRLEIKYFKEDQDGNKVPQSYDNTKTRIKLTPGVTQMERRLGAPLHGLMNAYCKLFTVYQRTSLVPRWKTLVLEDSNGAWLGRLKYIRVKKSLNTTAQSPTDWECKIQLPQEHFSALQQAWKELWYEQLTTQIAQTDSEAAALEELSQKTAENYAEVARLSQFMRKSIPDYREGEKEGLENWVARFRWEYPWPVSFEALPPNHEDRQAFKALNIEALLEEMEVDNQSSQLEVPQTLSQAEAADPTANAHSEPRGAAAKRDATEAELSYETLDWKKKTWTKEEWAVYNEHKEKEKKSRGSPSQPSQSSQWGMHSQSSQGPSQPEQSYGPLRRSGSENRDNFLKKAAQSVAASQQKDAKAKASTEEPK